MITKIIAIITLLFAIGFNLWLYRLEPTVTIDPNDNLFQYALVARTNEIWDFAQKQCGLNPLCFTGYLIDHWVPNWAQGYNLPFYYSHAPQIAIVASYRVISLFVHRYSLFAYYHLVIYLLLALFPLSVFLALRVIGPPAGGWLAAGIGALLASHISTDGLYGLDPPSFLWRGYGLSAQLFAMIFMPLAIAYFWKYVSVHRSSFIVHRKNSLIQTTCDELITNHASLAILFTILTTMGHLGMGIITLLSIGIMGMTVIFQQYNNIAIQQSRQKVILLYCYIVGKKLAIIVITTVVLLSYWIVPILLSGDYHNISFWDPVWKFNSYPWKETMSRLFNGELFDFGRFPVFTALTGIGIFGSMGSWGGKGDKGDSKYAPFAFLFLGWLLLYFGRTTWGGIIDLIPGMNEFHLSRFIVGLHLAGLFLAPIGLHTIVSRITKATSQLLYCYIVILLSVLAAFLLYPQSVRYAAHNDTLIKQANENYEKVKPDLDVLFATLKELPPGRVYFGRGGGWGKDFKVAETPMFIYASSMGFPSILWLPETWSPSSDVEQYFVEENPAHYDLFNLKYVVAPPDVKPQAFWKLSSEGKTWKLYTVETSGYFTSGTIAATVTSDKDNFKNVVRLWLQSDYPKQKLFPQLSFSPLTTYNKQLLPAFGMINESTYQTRDGKQFSLSGNVPVYEAPATIPGIEEDKFRESSESSDSDMIFKTSVSVGEKCSQCLLILKQTFHPNWKAYVDGKRVETMTVFPFLTAIRLDRPGDYTVEFRYEPSGLKKILLMITLTFAASILFYRLIPAKKTRDTQAA